MRIIVFVIFLLYSSISLANDVKTMYQMSYTANVYSRSGWTDPVYGALYDTSDDCYKVAANFQRKQDALLAKRLKIKLVNRRNYHSIISCDPIIVHPIDADTIEGDECDGPKGPGSC